MRARTGRMIATLAAALGVVMVLPAMVAAPASAAIDPAEEAWITAAGVPKQWQQAYPFFSWRREVTIRSGGAVAGRPGNRHTAELYASANPAARFPEPWRVTLTDEQCDAAGSCTTLWQGRATVNNLQQAVVDPVGPDGTVHLYLRLPAGSFSTLAPAGAPVPVGDTDVGVYLTPQGYTDPRNPDVDALPVIERRQSTDADQVHSPGLSHGGTAVAVLGSIAGVPADQVIAASWSDSSGVVATVGPPLTPSADPSVLAPYQPKIVRGRVAAYTALGPNWSSIFRGTLVTSTGYRFPGNAHDAYYTDFIQREAGDPVVGTSTGGHVQKTSYTCPASTTPLAQCQPIYDAPFLGTPTTLRYAFDGTGRLAVHATLPVTRIEADGSRTNLGTVRFGFVALPTGVGYRARVAGLNRTQGTWHSSRQLVRTVKGPSWLGGLAGHPDVTTNQVDMQQNVFGTL